MVYEFSSPSLAIAANLTRTMIATALRATLPAPKPTVTKVVKDYGGRPIYEMIWKTFLAKEDYLTIDAISQEVDEDAAKADEYRHEAMMYFKYLDAISVYVPVAEHAATISDLCDLLEAPLKDSSLVPTEFEDITNALRIANDYAEMIRADFEAQGYSKHATPDQMLNAYHGQYWSSNDDSGRDSERYPLVKYLDMEEHKGCLSRLVTLLEDPATSDQLCKFILNNTLGSAGLALSIPIRFPIFVNLMPQAWIARNATKIWDKRTILQQSMDPEQAKPSNVTDAEQTKLERNATQRFKDMDLERLYNDKITRSTGEEISGTSTPADQQPESASQRGKGKGKKRQTPFGHSSKQQKQQQTTIPDDTSYTPDPILNWQERDIISRFQGLANMEMRLDHMTRFNSNSEFAQALTKMEVRDDDIRAFERNSRAGRMYVITFTRMHRKPIFNPVS